MEKQLFIEILGQAMYDECYTQAQAYCATLGIKVVPMAAMLLVVIQHAKPK